MTYLEAISDGLREEMRRDESVFCLGEDIGAFGGAFKVTDGFLEEFGAERVIDTPLAENVIIGAAVGRRDRGHEAGLRDAVRGLHRLRLRPARQRRREAPLPPGHRGADRGPPALGRRLLAAGPFHSQNPEAWFLQAPGLKVVAPATAEDAKGLLVSAIRDPNPVCFLEHKDLYRHVKGEVPAGSTRCRSARLASPARAAS